LYKEAWIEYKGTSSKSESQKLGGGSGSTTGNILKTEEVFASFQRSKGNTYESVPQERWKMQ
jgi:hypothetical protein